MIKISLQSEESEERGWAWIWEKRRIFMIPMTDGMGWDGIWVEFIYAMDREVR